MFFKIAVLRNVAVTVKKTPIFECLFNKLPGLNACTLLKRDPNSVLKNFLRTVFFLKHLTVHYTFSKFYVMIELFGRL